MRAVSITFALGACISFCQAANVFPEPPGRYVVKWTSTELVDINRLDPFNSSHPRRMMISQFSPIPRHHCQKKCQVPYMTPRLASEEDAILEDYLSTVGWPGEVLQELKLEVCCKDTYSATKRKGFPTMILGTGLNTTRHFYSGLGQHLASMGYEVIVMDHPYETDIVEFPDGTVIYGGRIGRDPDDIATLVFGLDVRSRDASFVLDTLGKSHRSKVGYVGHSFGGASAAHAMRNETRIAGGANLDGLMFGPVLSSGVSRPFLIWGSTGHNSTGDDTWNSFLNATGTQHPETWKRELSLKGAAHNTFSDFSLIGDVSGLRANDQLVEIFFGRITGARTMKILREYLSDFYQFAVQGKSEGLLRKPNQDYPEVEFLV